MKPTLRVRAIADAYPSAPRKKIIELCVAQGVKATTASTIYAAWKKEHRVAEQARSAYQPTYEYSELVALSSTFGERNDCVVKMFSVVTGVHYKTMHMLCEIEGRKSGQGMRFDRWFPIFDRLGFDVEPIELNAKTLRSSETELRANYAGQKVVLLVRGHVVGFDGYEIQDWAAYSKRRIMEAWVVKPRRH